MIKGIYVLEILSLMAVDIAWLSRSGYKKKSDMLIPAASLILCGLMVFAKGDVGIYSFLVTAIVALFSLIICYDLKTKYIPNILLIILNVMGLITSFFVPNGIFLATILEAWLITGLCFLIGRKAKDGIGAGDLYCMSGLMMSMNFSGMMNFMFSALFLALIYGVGTLIMKKNTVKSEMAFAPFLLCGYGVMIVCS